MRRDPVTSDLRRTVICRDAGCVAPLLDPECGPCRDQWGRECHRGLVGALTIDHVQSGYGRMGRRAPSDAAHCVTLCWHHHVASGWATSHRPLLREYLARVNEVAA